jgi:hypothetical protein
LNTRHRKTIAGSPPANVEALRGLALQALVGLHDQPPVLLIELAQAHEYAVADCERERAGGCPACAAKRHTAKLLRAVAAMRTAVDAERLREHARRRD